MRPVAASRREYGLALLAGAVGAGLILLAVRQRWAEAVFTAPKPLTPQVVAVSGADLVPLAGALAVAALAGLAAVIATRGVLRRAAEHAGRSVRAALPQDQVRRQVTGLPAGAQRGSAGAGLLQQCGQGEAFVARVAHPGDRRL